MSDAIGPSEELPDYGRLLDAYIAGEATEAELQQFFDYIRDHPATAARPLVDASRRSFDEWARDPQLNAQFDPVLSNRMFDRLLTGIHETPVVPMYRRWGRLAVAAVVIGLLGIVAWWLVRQSPAPSTSVVTVTQPVHDVLPGGDKAVLTLGNGAKILLDSAAMGVVAMQGSATVQKLVNGRLSYMEGVGGEVPHNQNARKPLPGGQKFNGDADAHIVYNTLTTPRGGQYQLTLADGTRVWLNAQSSITYTTTFTGSERVVSVTGEVYMEVAKDAARPFHVKVNQLVITVLGTHFNINAYNDEPSVNTTLLEGLVRIDEGNHHQMILPGQNARVDKNGQTKIVGGLDTSEVVAWKNGYFQFNHADLPGVMRQIARWYDVTVEYKGPFPDMKFTGRISRNSNASDILKILEESEVHFTVEGKKIIVR
jgi:ferric-dicitrate binding protein FerR (iron transport regulator)